MKAAVRRQGKIAVAEVDEPVPAAGEVLVRTLACGICGSDLHMLHHCETMVPVMKRAVPASALFDPQQDLVFGHEFCAELLDYGPGTQRKLKPGTRVCALPMAVLPEGVATVGYHPRYPGGFGEQMVLQEPTLIEVPDQLPTEVAALTEPLAVAVHAVNKARLDGDEAILVIGCGPIGLAVIVALKARGIGPVVASDFSPARRALAEKLGADVVVDPARSSPYKSWYEVAAPSDYDPCSVAALIGADPQPRPCVIFECVGIPGMLDAIFTDAPLHARVVVVGVCMEPDTVKSFGATTKELNVQFSYAYTLPEFSSTLHRLADGTLNAAAMITGIVNLNDVPAVMGELSKAGNHAKVIIRHGD